MSSSDRPTPSVLPPARSRGIRAAVPEAFRMGPGMHLHADEAERKQRALRMVRAGALVILVLMAGTFGYHWLTDGAHMLMTCLYMTVITVSTVGFTEVIPIHGDPTLEALTMSLILFGGGSILYFLGSFTAMVIEGDLAHRLWRRRMTKRLEAMHDHVVVAGAGRNGIHVIRGLIKAGKGVVVIDQDPSAIEAVINEYGADLRVIIGDAANEANLRLAGIERASGLVAVLHEDRDNIFLCLTARQANPALRIISKVDRTDSGPMFHKVGVDTVVCPAQLGGERMADVMLAPNDPRPATEAQ